MKKLVLILAGAACLWGAGFFFYLADLPRPGAGPIEEADGVVVFTGGGGVRISTAMALFADGAGDRLLISGVHPDTSLASLAHFWVGPEDRFDCCIDIGRIAQTTEGNASEMREWAMKNNYRRLILVTSDFHMPRALTVSRARFPEAIITPRAAPSGYLDAKGRPTSLPATVKLAGEYTKLIAARAKAFASGGGR